MKLYLDANIFINAALDETDKGDDARKILLEITSGEKEGVTSTLALNEVMWVLMRKQQTPRIHPLIHGIYQLSHLKIISGSTLIPLRAVKFMEAFGLKPRDAFHAAIMEEENIDTIVSDDADFDKVKSIKRIF